MGDNRQELAPVIDGGAPIRAFRADAEAKETKRAQKDGGVANAQAEIDDQGPARIGQDFPQNLSVIV